MKKATGWVSIPGKGKRFFSSPKRSDRLGGPPVLLFSGYLGSVLGAERSERDVDNSPQPTSSTFHGVQWRIQEFFRGEGGLRQEFFWGVQQIKLRTEGRENGDLGAVAP
jgi:hypothetical protein